VTLAAPAWLLVVPAAAAVMLAALALRRRDRLALAPFGGGVVAQHGGGERVARFAELGACALLGAALAAPQVETGASRREPPPAIFVVDASRSMLAEDVAPDRFAAASAALLAKARAEPGRRFGLVVFAGDAKEVAPPTADFEALASLLAEQHPRRRADPGSDVGRGLAKAVARLATIGRGGEIVVLTDGEWDGEESTLVEATTRARELGVVVSGECVGRPEPARIVLRGELGEVDDSAAPTTTTAAPERVARLASLGAPRRPAVDRAPPSDAGARLRIWIGAGLLLLAAAHVFTGRES
jgi:Ca-activated chloride channel family protein